MKHLYEIFEQFPDGASLWRESAMGHQKAQRKVMEMARKSANPIYAIDLTGGDVIRIDESRGRNKTSTAPSGEFKEKKKPLPVE